MLNTLLELCQRIHYEALRALLYESYGSEIPSDLVVNHLYQQVQIFGPGVLLRHPSDIEDIFRGVTLAVYQMTESLYCNRLERSKRTVWRIMYAMMQQEQLELTYEGIWAICMYLQQRRAASIEVATERLDAIWSLALVQPDISIQIDHASAYQPVVVCVLDEQASRVLAFRVAHDEQLIDAIGLAVYDAIVAHRRPSRDPFGLIWQLPTSLLIEPMLSDRSIAVYQRLGINVTLTARPSPLHAILSGDWTRDISKHPMNIDHFVKVFDTYLTNIHGYGPLNARQNRERQARQFIGYNRDPGWQFPALRELLPIYESKIGEDGSIELNDLHYMDDLLKYWPGCTVTIRPSIYSEASAWVYLDNEVLCQARSRELRRPDGSYWRKRPHR